MMLHSGKSTGQHAFLRPGEATARGCGARISRLGIRRESPQVDQEHVCKLTKALGESIIKMLSELRLSPGCEERNHFFLSLL